MHRYAHLAAILLMACGAPNTHSTDMGDDDLMDSTPRVIVDKNRKVMSADLVPTEVMRNQCSLGIGEYIIQWVPLESDCGELPDEIGDMSTLDEQVLSIPSQCTLGHYYTQTEQCTVTTELICQTPDGCTETRYQDFDWKPNTDGRPWFGDGILKYTRECPTKTCMGTYHAAAFPIPD